MLNQVVPGTLLSRILSFGRHSGSSDQALSPNSIPSAGSVLSALQRWGRLSLLGGLSAAGGLCDPAPLFAQNQYTPPVVIGSTGKPYGPTQAEWQYRQQYGRPSPGSRGNSGLQFVNGYPGGGGSFGGHRNFPGGWGGWGPQLYMGFDPFAYYPPQGYYFAPSTASYSNGFTTNLNYGNPGYGIAPNPALFPNLTPPVLQPLPPNDPLTEGFGMGQSQAAIQSNPFPTTVPQVVQPSSPKALETSHQYQTQGDIQFGMLNYYAAGERYRKAIDAARDRADPRWRLAITLAARGRFLEAVDQLKLAAAIDPTFPQASASLEDLFGAANLIEKERVKDRVAEWTLQDPRDPNRLFLSGVFLYLDGDPNSRLVLETATMIAGEQPHLTAFLAPRTIPIPKPATATQASPPVPHPPRVNGASPEEGAQAPKVPIHEAEIPPLPPHPGEQTTDVPKTNFVPPSLPPLMSP